eukprot:scaffold103064_cov25-Prasinocladus_malaysianus.AAC.1
MPCRQRKFRPILASNSALSIVFVRSSVTWKDQNGRKLFIYMLNRSFGLIASLIAIMGPARSSFASY